MPASSKFFEWSYYLNFYVTVNLIDFSETKKSIIFTSVLLLCTTNIPILRCIPISEMLICLNKKACILELKK